MSLTKKRIAYLFICGLVALIGPACGGGGSNGNSCDGLASKLRACGLLTAGELECGGSADEHCSR